MQKIRFYGLMLVLMVCGMINGALGATFSYKDIRKPHGRVRGLEALTSDAHFCDQKVGPQKDLVTSEYNKCMLSRGWRFSHTE